MVFECPDIIKEIQDIAVIYAVNDILDPVKDAERLDLDLCAGTATEQGIRRRERLYGIIPKDTDTLEDRRFRIRARENEITPYTVRTMRNKLAAICGENGYTAVLQGEKLIIRVALPRRATYEDARKMMEEMIPLNICLECTLLYNQHKKLAEYTHAELAVHTHGYWRNEVLKK
jgi:hypothetical protein